MPRISRTVIASYATLTICKLLKNRWKEVFLVFLLVLVISVVVTFLMPPSYRATSQFQIKLPKPVMEIGQGGDVVASSNVTANYIPMQYSVLTSTESSEGGVQEAESCRGMGHDG